MSDAKRQAHAAAEFDEAAALRRAGGQAGEDLEVMVAEIDDWHRYAIDPQVDRDARTTAMANLGDLMLDHWPTIRASLERMSQQEDVIARMDREVEGHIELVVETQRSRDAALARERELREALEELVQHPGYLRRTDNDPRSGLTYFCEFCGNAQHDEGAQPMFFHPDWCLKRRAKALLAQPAAGEERERG